MAPGRERSESSLAYAIQDPFRQDAARRIVGTKKQYVQRLVQSLDHQRGRRRAERLELRSCANGVRGLRSRYPAKTELGKEVLLIGRQEIERLQAFVSRLCFEGPNELRAQSA